MITLTRDILAEFSRHNARMRAARRDYATRMARMEAPARPCIDCGQRSERDGRCLPHARAYDRGRWARRNARKVGSA